MKKVLLERLETSDQGTFGRLAVESDEEVHYFFTIELPWRENKSNISCVPPGSYPCKWTLSPRFGRHMFEVMKVPGRFSIRIHSGCLAGDVSKGLKSHFNGCIGLSEKLGSIEGQRAALVSRPAVRQFETLMNGEDFVLEIREPSK